MDNSNQIWIITQQATGKAFSKAVEQTEITKAGAPDTYKRQFNTSRADRHWDNFRLISRTMTLVKFADSKKPTAILLNHYCSGLFRLRIF